MEIYELRTYSLKQFRQLSILMTQLSERIVLTEQCLNDVLRDVNSHLYVLIEGEQIIGCATLCVFNSPSGLKATVEDVVVSEEYRGRHLGRMLVSHVLDEAKRLGHIELHLTSKPQRVAANALYQSLGFKRRDTNCYVLI